MRLAITSDLHYPVTPDEAIKQLVAEVRPFEPDLLVLAGDLGESLPGVESCLRFFHEIGFPVAVIPGNHDLFRSGGISSQRLWETRLPEAVRDANCTWLEAEAIIHEGIAVVGTIAWYDYSAADQSIQESRSSFAQNKGSFMLDAKKIDWPWSDWVFARQVGESFLEKLDELETDPTVQQTVVVTHVPILECQIPRRPNDRNWGFSNAYFGNLTLGNEVLKRRKVTLVISGHTHLAKDDFVKTSDSRAIRGMVVPHRLNQPGWIGLEIAGEPRVI